MTLSDELAQVKNIKGKDMGSDLSIAICSALQFPRLNLMQMKHEFRETYLLTFEDTNIFGNSIGTSF